VHEIHHINAYMNMNVKLTACDLTQDPQRHLAEWELAQEAQGHPAVCPATVARLLEATRVLTKAAPGAVKAVL